MSKVRIGMLAGLALLAALAVFLVQGLTQSPKAEAWDRWAAHDPESQLRVSHRAWQQFSGALRQGQCEGRQHRCLWRGPGGRPGRARSLFGGARGGPRSRATARDEQLSYWINLYNALTVDVVLDHYPVDSILQINPSANPLAKGPWDEPVITVEGQEISLNGHRASDPSAPVARSSTALCAQLRLDRLPGPDPLGLRVLHRRVPHGEGGGDLHQRPARRPSGEWAAGVVQSLPNGTARTSAPTKRRCSSICGAMPTRPWPSSWPRSRRSMDIATIGRSTTAARRPGPRVHGPAASVGERRPRLGSNRRSSWA